MIKMECPNCGHQLRIRSKFAGKKGECKHCHRVVDVPNTYAEAAANADESLPNDVGTLSTKLAKATALADLMTDDTPQPADLPPPVASTKSTKILARSDSYKPLGCLYWLLALFLTPAALVWGILLPSGHPQKGLAIAVPIAFIGVSIATLLVVFLLLPILLLSAMDEEDADLLISAGELVITPSVVDMEVSPYETVTLKTNSPSGMANDLTWQSSDPSIAKLVGGPRSAMVYGMSVGTVTVTAENIMTGERATAKINVIRPSAKLPDETPVAAATPGQSYAQTRLPSYPTLTFSNAANSNNELSGPLADSDPATLSTFMGYVTLDYEEITAFFYEELGNRGWIIDDYGYGDEANSETYIIGTKDSYGIVYRTSKAASRTRVVITYGPLN